MKYLVIAVCTLLLGCKAQPEENQGPSLVLPQTIKYTGASVPEGNLKNSPKIQPPEGMILIPAGKVRIGSEEGFDQERPMFWAELSDFYMDISPVTVAQFRAFVKSTNYKTEADVFGNAGIIHESTDKNWILKDGANWEYPLGKDFPKAADDHPVTQVSWNDANAYAKWAGKRLPHEIEWEHAARNAKNSREIYPWGNDLNIGTKFRANVWNGEFPNYNENTDGFAETSPVGYYGKTPLGLTDMSGNVWEWCSNELLDYKSFVDHKSILIKNEKAQRGGSFLCEPSWCHGYRVSGRSSSSAETSLFHVGFRCVKDIN